MKIKNLSKYLQIIILSIVVAIFYYSCKEAPSDAPEIITKITGKVTDGQTNEALAGSQITTNPVTSSVITGGDGNYTIPNVTPGQYTITCSKDGYNQKTTIVNVSEGQTVVADIQLIKLGPELAVSVQNLDFDVAQTNLTFSISNKTKIGTVTWQIQYNQQWMNVSPTTGTSSTESDLISVSVDRAGLNYGNYSGTITISSDFGSSQVSVLMVVQNPSAPQLTVTPIQIDFGATGNNETVTIKNTGTGTLNWSASTSDNWIQLSASSGSSLPGNPSNIIVSINRSGLTPNNYEGTVSFTSNGGNQNLIVKMEVEQGTLIAPTLQVIGSPTANSITIGWTKVLDPLFANYKIYRSIVPGVNESSSLVTTITDPNQNNYSDSGLNDGTIYYYRVFVYSTSGIGSGSNEVNASTSTNIGDWVVTATIPNVLSSYLTPNSLYPVSDNDVWFAFKNQIWHYDGAMWSLHFSTSDNNYDHFKAIWAIDQNNIWAVGYGSGYYGIIYKYNGITWSQITTSIPNMMVLHDIVASSANDIWISADYGLYHFNGVLWNKFAINADAIIDMDIISASDIWSLDKYGKVFKYDGIGWAYIGDANELSVNKAIQVLSSNDVWIAAKTLNGSSISGLWHYDGSTFSGTYKLPQGSSLYAGRNTIEMISSNLGWSAKSWGPIEFSFFDGNTWQSVISPISSGVYCIKMLSSNIGWAVGGGGEILRYSE